MRQVQSLPAGGCEREFEAVELRRPDDLAGQARGRSRDHRVELVLLLVGRGIEPSHPLVPDEDMARGAFAGATAQAVDGKAPVADDFHDAPTLDAFEGVTLAFAVGHMDDAHDREFLKRNKVLERARWRRTGWISVFRANPSMLVSSVTPRAFRTEVPRRRENPSWGRQ